MQGKGYASIETGTDTIDDIGQPHITLKNLILYLNRALIILEISQIRRKRPARAALPDQVAQDMHKQKMVSQCLPR
jgi:hypothetical protein